MIGPTFGLYLAKDFLRNVLLIFVLFFFLIVTVDLIELSRELGRVTHISFVDILLISLFRAPAFAENILPFATLFGASTSLMVLNKRLELVVARASGVSVWQFLLPLMVSAALLGSLASLAYNPLSLAAQVTSRALEARVFGKIKGGFSNKSKNFWIRAAQDNGDVVVRARVSQEAGVKLTTVTAFVFEKDGSAVERMDANSAEFFETDEGNFYLLKDVRVTPVGQVGQTKDEVRVPIKLSKAELQADQTDPSAVSVWQLGRQADRALESGKSALPFYTRFQSMLAQPLLFVAMVLLAATVSLTFARFGINGKAILGGVLAGFVLYVLTKLVITFGSNGLVPPAVAAWSPALVASLIGVTMLLKREDG